MKTSIDKEIGPSNPLNSLYTVYTAHKTIKYFLTSQLQVALEYSEFSSGIKNKLGQRSYMNEISWITL